MRLLHPFLPLVMLCTLAGCAHRTDTAVSQPAPPADVQAVRQAIRASDPKAIVGVVTAVLPDTSFASVGDVPVADFHVGEVVTFIDGEQHSLTHGVVKGISGDSLHVQYDKPATGGREPQVGDLAVRFKP